MTTTSGDLTQADLDRALEQARARSQRTPDQLERAKHGGFTPVKLEPRAVRMSEPKYPPAGRMDGTAWLAGKRGRCVGTVHVEINHSGDCASCGGEGIVYLRFMADGPKRYQVGGIKPSAWLASTPGVREGWYVIEDRKGYQCPRCDGSGYEPGEGLRNPSERGRIEA